MMAGGCVSRPLNPFTTDTPPLILAPVSVTDVHDGRGRFREIYCAVTGARGRDLPDYRPCDEALVALSGEPAASGRAVALDESHANLRVVVVPGVGWDCLARFVGVTRSGREHVEGLGYRTGAIAVEGLSGSTRNAVQVRDAVLAFHRDNEAERLVMIGYSKGVNDILEAIVTYPEIRPHIAAVVSHAGAVGGSPLATDTPESLLGMLRFAPGAECEPGDGQALKSLRPDVRQRWLAENPLPDSIRYLSLVTFPHPDNISSVLTTSYNKLSRVDARNDSQVIFYDQVIPGSVILAYMNADHWAVALPLDRNHRFLGSTFVNRNEYPREVLLESVLRYVEEDLEDGPMPGR